jgi:hypothetical protein
MRRELHAANADAASKKDDGWQQLLPALERGATISRRNTIIRHGDPSGALPQSTSVDIMSGFRAASCRPFWQGGPTQIRRPSGIWRQSC